MNNHKKTIPVVEDEALLNTDEDSSTEWAQLQGELQSAREAQLRSQADYQNLQRRTQEERSRLVKMAAKELMSDLLQPLDHLSLAATQLKDQGLDMTMKQLWQTLEGYGLKEMEVMGQNFDVSLMEVVERKESGEKVIGVVNRGYTLHGEVIKHAKVIVGEAGAQSPAPDTATLSDSHS